MDNVVASSGGLERILEMGGRGTFALGRLGRCKFDWNYLINSAQQGYPTYIMSPISVVQLLEFRWGIISTGRIAGCFVKDALIDPKTCGTIFLNPLYLTLASI